jgi:hypothetical protein
MTIAVVKILLALTIQILYLAGVSDGFSENSFSLRSLISSVPVRLAADGIDNEAGLSSPNQSLEIEGRGKLTEDTIYFDIEVANQPVGRLIFHLTNPSPLPLHAENIIQLAKGSRRGIDPKAHYIGCEFDFSPNSVEDGMGRYRWGHQLKGRNRNAIGRAEVPIVDPKSQLRWTHSCFGGQYYGDLFREEPDDPGVVLTVPVAGPGRGSTKFSIVRVGESPKEWRERLLINCGVIGRLDPSCLDVLHAMARQRIGPPTVVGAGAINSK